MPEAISNLSANQVWALACFGLSITFFVIGWLYGRRGNVTVQLSKMNKNWSASLALQRRHVEVLERAEKTSAKS